MEFLHFTRMRCAVQPSGKTLYICMQKVTEYLDYWVVP